MSLSHQRVLRIMSGQARDPAAKLLRLATRLGEGPYKLAVQRRNRKFDARDAVSLGRPTISVGNITTGGTGKTPMVMDIVQRLIEMGQQPAVLLRGYQGKKLKPRAEEQSDKAPDGSQKDAPPAPRFTSDEEQVYVNAFQNSVHPIPVAADPDRVRSAIWVLHHHPQTTCFVMDDAFQHRRVRRDLDIVLIDATRPFGFGHVLPRGLLREPLSGLARADAVIVTHADAVTAEQLANVDQQIEQHAGQPPLTHTAHSWDHLQHNDDTLPLSTLAHQKILGATGIGNPAAFEHTLHQHAADLVAFQTFDDHHDYTPADLAALQSQAQKLNAAAIVTTDKDWVKWQPLLKNSSSDLPIYRPALALQYLDGAPALQALLQKIITLPTP